MLLLLTVSAVILLVPAFVGLLGVEKHRHLAQSEDSGRWARVAVAATVVGLAALATAAVLGADAVPALAVAVVLSVSVLVWAPLSRSWAVRGVVVWALLVMAVLGFMAWLAQQIWVSSLSPAERRGLGWTAAAALLCAAPVHAADPAGDAWAAGPQERKEERAMREIEVALMQLDDEGALSIDDPLSTWLPDYPNGANVSVQQLLNHTSGIQSYTGIPGYMDQEIRRDLGRRRR